MKLSPFVNDGPVVPMLKELSIYVLKLLSFVFREFEQPLSWRPLTLLPDHSTQLRTFFDNLKPAYLLSDLHGPVQVTVSTDPRYTFYWLFYILSPY